MKHRGCCFGSSTVGYADPESHRRRQRGTAAVRPSLVQAFAHCCLDATTLAGNSARKKFSEARDRSGIFGEAS
jgi:hypothetical protein